MDTSVTSPGSVDSYQQLSPTSSILPPSQPFFIATKTPVTVQLTLTCSSPDASDNRCGGVMSSNNMPVKSVLGKTSTCKVCGDESSGYHYGVDSCEGCKGFFRRCITQGMTHKCSNEEKCEITPFTRNSCQYCRLKKCFAVGMSREASRLGRRPKRLKDCSHEHKRETAVPIAPYPSASELYNLRMAELQKLLPSNGAFKSELMQAFLAAAQVSFKEHQRNNTTNDNQKAKKSSTSLNSNQGAESSYTSSNMSSPQLGSEVKSSSEIDQDIQNKNVVINTKVGIIKENLENCRLDEDITTADGYSSPSTAQTNDTKSCTEIKVEPLFDNNEFSNDCMLKQNMPDAGSPFYMSELSPDTMIMMPDMMIMMEDSNMMSSMMSAMGMPDMMNSSLPHADDNGNEIDVEHIMDEVKQTPSALRRELIDQVIQTVGEAHLATVTPTRGRVNLANERFQQKLLNGTLQNLKFIDPHIIWHKFVQNMLYEITQAIKFCKKLPGFTEIEQEDQILLIKKGSFEILLCRMCLLVDIVSQEMFDPTMEMKSPRVLIKNMPMGYFIDEFFNVAAEMNPLELTDREIGIFSAALIMCPEREGLANVLAIKKLNTLYLQSLYCEMRNNHSDYERNFTRLLCLIPIFNNVNMRHSMTLNSLKMQKAPEICEFPDLHKEIFDIKDD